MNDPGRGPAPGREPVRAALAAGTIAIGHRLIASAVLAPCAGAVVVGSSHRRTVIPPSGRA